eukprot:Blabericola_migrator_1__8793@NODE_4638_length_1048_cov_197_240571_g2884_i0_p1_GENE_NODE_4638_length_1048_cov_197_240571_g2884_i0NODE_4638_length_1048_cov_197_240571_g2884_i0_p1_ORF_typecomplete_len198_score32_55LIDHydrolase/PF10230_9/0_00012LIDHydrolase/PF10230_9/1_4e03DLH/PF01738_18/0_081Hydrolase_4/PF12146_8/0_085FSH1/PF03959_13/0_16_NODE_4638_length_1048_cov_197_240571_g2884_i071595
MKKSERVKNFAKDSPFIQRMMEELTEKVIGNMSTLLKDELKWLPRNRVERIQAIENLSLPTFFLFAANDPYVPKSFQTQIYKVFGRDHVFIGQQWWHAYCLHSAAFLESAELTESIMREGRVPSLYSDKMVADTTRLWSAVISDLQTAVASVMMTLWVLPQVVKTSCTRRKNLA